MVTRRTVLQGSLVAGASFVFPAWRAKSLQKNSNRFVLFILRGGLDGLAALAPYGDAGYRSARGRLALAAPGSEQGVLDLNGVFGLHPNLEFLKSLYDQKSLIGFQGVAMPYRSRSHFDAQDILETGLAEPEPDSSGWLYRSLHGLPGGLPLENQAISIGSSIPRVLRGSTAVSSWSPEPLPNLDDNTMERLLALYREDPFLGPKLNSALRTEMMAGNLTSEKPGQRRSLITLAEKAGTFLAQPDGPGIAVLESNGWDSHANQGAANGAIAAHLKQLDGAIKAIRHELGPSWTRTAVLVVTEFGRTAWMNGTAGTDHGTGSAAFLAGGAVSGGRLIEDWTGFEKKRLHEGRDVPPVMDLRSVFHAVLQDHLGLDDRFLENHVFEAGIKKMPGLFHETAPSESTA